MRRPVVTMLAAIAVLSGCAAATDDPGNAATGTPTTAVTTPASEPSPQVTAPSEAETATATPTPTEEAATGTVITTGDSDFGEMLFDTDDQAIYLFDVERAGTPDCYDDCAVAWPPVLTDGAPQASGNVDADLLGTTERSDGTIQVTYNDHPLYYYAHEAPGEVRCHNVNLNGGLWYVLQPDGNPAPPG